MGQGFLFPLDWGSGIFESGGFLEDGFGLCGLRWGTFFLLFFVCGFVLEL